MAATYVVGVEARPVEAAPLRGPAAAALPLERPDEAAAFVTARITGKPVKISGLTTETAEYTAQPNGTVETTLAAAPVRIRRDGHWVPVDLTLTRGEDGSITPLAHPEGLQITGGRAAGTGALATLGGGADQITIGWSGKLPEPALDGSRATYTEVRPGIDLVVQATRLGFEQFLVVKNRQAAAQVATIAMPLGGKGATTRTRDAGGAVALKNRSGRTVATVPTPEMWDAHVGADGLTPVRRAPLKSALSKKAVLQLTPDPSWIADPATTFPVTLDPSVVVSTSFDTYVKDGDTADHGGANDLQIGLLSGTGGKRTRSFVSWDTTGLKGKQITAATVKLYNFYSTTCTANSWEVWTAPAFDSTTRWSNMPAWTTKNGTSTQTKGFDSSCGDGWVSVSAPAFFQYAATANASRGWMGIRATNEAATSAFKQFRSRNAADNAQVPTASITYNSYPVVGTRSTTPAAACGSGSTRPYLGSKTPQLKATLTDADASTLTASFEWSTTAGTPVTTATTAKAASGSTFATTIPAGALVENGAYRWRVRGYDGTAYSPWSRYCEFTVDTTAPNLPAISSTDYPEGQWAGGTGTTGQFTLASGGSADVTAYEYGLDVNPPTQNANAATVGGGATVGITPTSDGPHLLYVRTRDRAGNRSAVKSYQFNVGGAGLTRPAAGDLIAEKTTLAAAPSPGITAVTYQWRRGNADAWTTIPVADVRLSAGGGNTAWPLSTGANGFPNLVWDVAKTLNDAEVGPDPLAGPLQVRGSFNGGSASRPVVITFDRDQAAAESDTVGPGSANLVTGNLTVQRTDVTVAAGGAGLTVSRTFNTRQAGAVDPLFGPGWQSNLAVSEAQSPYTYLDEFGSLVQVETPDGSMLGFTKRSASATSTEFDPQPGEGDRQLVYRAADNRYTLSDDQKNTVTFSRPADAPEGHYVATAVTPPGSGNTSTLAWESATVDGRVVERPTRMLAPVPAGVSCDSGLVRGCRGLTFGYAISTTASGSGLGDVAGRLRTVSYVGYDPETGAMRTQVLAQYAYDATGRLRASWDPRLDYQQNGATQHFQEAYEYDTAGVLTQLKPPGQEPWRLTYTTLPGDAGAGRMYRATRGGQEGAPTETVVYRVPLSGAGAPYDLSNATINRWGQNEPPVDATAVFPATQIPDGNPSAGTLPSSFERATVTYLDANARQLDTAEPGGAISATWYDDFGNVTRELGPGNRRHALDASPSDDQSAEAALAAEVATETIYSADGQRLVDTLGPEHDVVLNDGSEVRGRVHERHGYDEGAPAGTGPFNLETSVTTTVRFDHDGHPADADARVVKTAYDWTLLSPSSQVIDPTGLALTSSTTYDASGDVQNTTSEGGAGSTTSPATTSYVYYTAAANSAHAECGGHAEWAGLVCWTGPGGAPATGPDLVHSVATYDYYGSLRTQTESNTTGVQRRRESTYDSAGRPYVSSLTAAASLGLAVESRRSVYDPATGQLVRSQTLDGTGAVTAEIVRTFDNLGRQVSYQDADGNGSADTFDGLGRLSTSNDGKAVRTFHYDEGAERRGLVTSVDDSQAGHFAGSYDVDGNLSAQSWPTGARVETTWDEVGDSVGLTYTKPNCGAEDCTLFTESVASSTAGQWRQHVSSLSSQVYEYDDAGRLSTVKDTVDDQCETRAYGFNAGSDRTSQVIYGAADDGSCQGGAAASTRTWSYDTADRTTGDGYQYDALGRTTAVPAIDAGDPDGPPVQSGYFANDMVASLRQGGRTTIYTLDVDTRRMRSWTDDATGAVVTHVNHYDGDTDSPAWTQESPARYTRTIADLGTLAGTYDGATGQIEWAVTNLHGDVVATIAGTDAGLSSTCETTEFGKARDTQQAGARRYGYLGSYQRAADNPAGLVLMGVRVYNPNTGRFLSTDPVLGGNANPYIYPADPVNQMDVSGQMSWWLKSAVKALIWGLKKGIPVLCKLAGAWAWACGAAIGGIAGALTYWMKGGAHTTWGYVSAFFVGAATGVFSAAGGKIVKFLVFNKYGLKIITKLEKVKGARKIIDKILDYIIKNG